MKIGNFFLALIFLSSFLIVWALEKKKIEVKKCDDYAARNKPFKVEDEIEPNEITPGKNISCIWSFGSDQKCKHEWKILEAGKYSSEQCHNIQSSPKITFDGTKCALEFSETSNVNTLIKEKHRQHHTNTFM